MWYYATVEGFDRYSNQYHIRYADDTDDWMNMSQRRFILQINLKDEGIIPVFDFPNAAELMHQRKQRKLKYPTMLDSRRITKRKKIDETSEVSDSVAEESVSSTINTSNFQKEMVDGIQFLYKDDLAPT